MSVCVCVCVSILYANEFIMIMKFAKYVASALSSSFVHKTASSATVQKQIDARIDSFAIFHVACAPAFCFERFLPSEITRNIRRLFARNPALQWKIGYVRLGAT